MSTTWIKRLENRSRSTITLLNKENPNTRGHLIGVPSGSRIAVDMPIPWAPVQSDFAGHHLELVVGGATKYWIWQATNADGDFIRYSTDGVWHDQGEHVHGYAGSANHLFEAIPGFFANGAEELAQLYLAERAIIVLDSHFESIPIPPKPFGPASTFIMQLENRSSVPIVLFSAESGQTVTAAPGATVPVNNMAVPWALAQGDFPTKHLKITMNGVSRFWIWQHDHVNDGDYVRFSTNGAWNVLAPRVKGFAETGESRADLVFTTHRSIIVTDTGFEVMPHPSLLDGLLDFAKPLIKGAARIEEHPQTAISVPKKSAVAFSMAGPVSDKFLRSEPGARFTYKDSGKRYEFKLSDDGKVTATHPDGTVTLLDKARSFNELRKGKVVPLPEFDMIAANGGRVFAKVKGADDFYFAGMDHLFIHAFSENGPEVSIPSTYFKLDPEFNQPNQNPDDLLFTTNGIPGGHPASERFAMFRTVLKRQLTDMMIAKVEFREWQQLDARPPQNVIGLAGNDLLLQLAPLVLAVLSRAPGLGLIMLAAQVAWFLFVKDLVAEKLRENAEKNSAPPANTPIFLPIKYRRDDGVILNPPAISFKRVIDIGVGAVHHHQQYQLVTGCEMQALKSVPFYADLYRFFNGPLEDGDGYCDGTINYYALVESQKPDGSLTYLLLYQDEQFYFSQRWRIVGPDDTKGSMFNLPVDLQRAEYQWNRATYWSPLDNGHINADSRLAVSAQVLLLTGQIPGTNTWRIYSINASWGTMDRTWRWRELPKLAPNSTDSVDHQSIQLRDDMTLSLKGVRGNVSGRWYQRYLPADNKLVPAGNLTAGQMPSSGYNHEWKFLSDRAFRLADNFHFFGVYDEVDARTQYYEVTPATAQDAATLEAQATNPRPWIDDARQLYVSQWKLNWEDPKLLGAKPLDPPSIFNPDTRLRIVKKGSRWIAMHWDKRDDDLTKFERLPMQVTLKKTTPEGAVVTARVTIGAHRLLLQTPVVQDAYFWLEPNGMAGVAFASSVGVNALRENISRVRMASLDAVAGDPTRAPRVNWFLSKETEGNFAPIGPGIFEFRWTPTATELALLQQHANANGARDAATSIWFEDIVGNVAPPEEILWQRSPRAKAVATPAMIPLGVPTQVTVRASDLRTDAPLANGVVKVDGQVVGTTDVPFTFTFNTRIEEEFDPELRITIRTVVNPAMTVTVTGYPEVDVPLTFFTPKLEVRLEPAQVPVGPTVQVLVRAEDATTHAPVQGRVMIGGADVGPTNTPINVAFGPTNFTGGVIATGYPTKGFPIGLFTPEMQVSVTPSPIPTGRPVEVIVRAVDKRTGLPVNGRVKLNGVDTAATNTQFMFTFGLTPPVGVVSAQFYADVAIAWPPLFVSTLTTGITPMPPPINKTVLCTVSAKNAQTGQPVAGRVRIGGVDVAATNTQFSTIFKGKPVGAEQELVMPEVTVTAFGYNQTRVETGF